MKKNWRKAAIGTTIAFLAIFVSSGSSSPIRPASTARRADRDHQTSKHGNSRRIPVAITLTVHVLPTSDGMEGEGMYANRYPKSISIPNAGALASQIAAFGAAYHVWIGPTGWTGSSAVGVDGNTVVNLYPVGGSTRSGPHIQFYEVPACLACMLGGAAPYFPSAKQEYNEEYGKMSTLPPAPPDLRIFPLSSTLVTYSLPDVAGLIVRGVVCFKKPDEFLKEAEFHLPHADANLLHFLMHTFVRREKLK